VKHIAKTLGFVLISIVVLSAATQAHLLGNGKIHLQCDFPSDDTLKLTVHGGRAYAQKGEVFGFDLEDIRVKRCQRVEITFINADEVRHAFMIDGLSPGFMIELPGKGQKTASFVAPAENATLLLHCHVPGHDRAGMNGQFVVGRGDGSLRSTTSRAPGVWTLVWMAALGLLGGAALGSTGVWAWSRRSAVTE